MHEHITVFYQKVRICMDILQYFIKIIYFTIFCASPFKNMQNSTFTLILTIYVQIPCTGTSCLAMLNQQYFLCAVYIQMFFLHCWFSQTSGPIFFMGMREHWAGGGGRFSAPPPLLFWRVWGGAEKKSNLLNFLGRLVFKGTASQDYNIKTGFFSLVFNPPTTFKLVFVGFHSLPSIFLLNTLKGQ